MEKGCRRPECTVAQTGKCLLNNDPATCAERFETLGNLDDGELDIKAELTTSLEPPKAKPKFPSSFTLSPDEAQNLMSERYCHVVGILGAPDAGKTACLVSLYLLLGRAKLDGFEFCDSRTLIAFEEIARGARRWDNGHIPEQMTSHTKLADERTAGYLHLRLRAAATGQRVDLLLPDLPGEWTNALIDNNRVDRLDFLKSADVLWIMLDGRNLIETASRMHAIHRARLLLQRVATFLSPAAPPVLLVITRLDLGKPAENTLEKLADEAASLGIKLRIAHLASFADGSVIDAGTGISDLLLHTVSTEESPTKFWEVEEGRDGHRSILRFRKLGATF